MPPTQQSSDTQFDVAIIGTGLSGTILGSILARKGFRVILLDRTHHPRFAIGESTIAQTLSLLQLIAKRYDVPEIAWLGSFEDTVSRVGSSHGRKSNFGFMLHHDGMEPDPAETTMLRLLDTSGAHLFRQDSDAFMLHTAIRYGCTARQDYDVQKIVPGDDSVTILGADGSQYSARYLVDASGFRSPLATELGLRETPARLTHHARSVFTHMIGVKSVEDVITLPPAHVPPEPYASGTLHHLFDHGWMWIIPFGNHARATNPLCSVGIQLDPRYYPASTDLSAEEEFWRHVDRFPAVRRQLAGARSVREWVRTGRLQYSSRQTVGHRWCLMSHAAGFIDPLFSRGLANTCEIINTLAWRLIGALHDDDFSAERFAYVEQLEQGLLDYNDKLVSMSFIAFSNFDLWNAVFRIWSCANSIGGKRFLRAAELSRETGDDQHYQRLDDYPYPGLWWPVDFYAELLDEAVAVCHDVADGKLSAQAAAEILTAKIRESDWLVPSLGFNRPDVHFIDPTPEKMAMMHEWARQHRRPAVREYLTPRDCR
jgi:tetracycline 7-halogenase / FADH2 O2-dependent halogenase